MAITDNDVLDLPDAPDFISKPPTFTWSQHIAMCEEMLPYWNTLRYSKPAPEFIGESFKWIEPTAPPAKKLSTL